MLAGETIQTGASNKCPDCGTELKLRVLHSNAGYYVGTMCSCGPHSRESGYYKKRETAQKDLDAGMFDRS